MADEEKKRIVQYQEASDFRNDDYALIDNSITGTRKIKVDGKLVKVTDVQVDNTTVMDGSIAKIDLTGKQDVLTPGANIQISGNTISATDTTYSAGTNIQINAQNEISATDTTYSAFSGSSPGLVPSSDSSSQTKYLRGDGSWATPPGGGGGGSTVSITPIVTSGTQIATATVDGVTSDLYAPTPPTVSVNQIQSTGTKIGEVIINNVANDLYAPNPTQVSVGQIQSSGTKIASISVDGSATDIYAPSGGSGSTVSVTQLQSTGTRIATVTVDNVSTDLYSPNPGSTVTITNTEPSGTTVATIGIDGVDTDIKIPAGSNSVEQVSTSTDAGYNILFSGTPLSGDTTLVEGARKCEGLSYNPSSNTMFVTGTSPSYMVSSSTDAKFASLDPNRLQIIDDETDPNNRRYIIASLDGSYPSIEVRGLHSGECQYVKVNQSDIELGAETYGANTWDGTNTSLKSAIASAHVSVTQIGTIYEGGIQTFNYTLPNNAKFSDYDYIMFVCGSDTYYGGLSTIISSADFEEYRATSLYGTAGYEDPNDGFIFYNGGVWIQRTSDTSIHIRQFTSGSGLWDGSLRKIYGINI